MTFPLEPIILDLEIIKAVPMSREPVIPGIEYCRGWNDKAGMGISVVCTAELHSGISHVICEDNKQLLEALLTDPKFLWVTFNGIQFDNQVLAANWFMSMPLAPPYHYDILREIWLAMGLGPVYNHSTHSGYSLDAMAEANGLGKKSGDGALAPILWQQGKIGAVIDYCLRDVELTAKLFCSILMTGFLVSPKDGQPIMMRDPFEGLRPSNPLTEGAVEEASINEHAVSSSIN